MKQPSCENHWCINTARNEMEKVDYKAIHRLGPNNPISKRVKAIRRNMDSLEQLVLEHGLDGA